MQKHDINATALAAVVAAGAIALAVPSAGWTSLIAGVTLLFILFGFDQEGFRTGFQSLAFGAACGFSLTIATAGFTSGHSLDMSGANVPVAVLVWAGASLVFLGIDRARIGGRSSSMSLRAPAAPLSTFVTQPSTFVPQPQPQTAVRPEAERAPVFEPPAARIVEPEQPQLVAESEPAHASPGISAPAEVTPQPTPVVAIPPGVGKPATVYLNLVGEGMTLLRSVQAEHLGKDFYRIVEPMPEGENWEFKPGQVVRCVKKKLSTGKALVAVEEAPRAR